MGKHAGRYSVYIRPFSYALDLIIINLLAGTFLFDSLTGIYYHFFVSISWIVIAWNVDFYEVYRYTKVIEILEKIFKQYVIYLIVNFAYIGYFLKFSEPSMMVKFVSLTVILIAAEKLFVYYSLRQFRATFGGNFRKVVIVGDGKT
ncbi:hypothetical protein [Flavobacterium sp. 3HN19-14]|uniref:hypothetical protein n=1 Tax=Flavobacterium sp. 3HN19-14 TaxID=3448133 RepID=UPI003EDFC230